MQYRFVVLAVDKAGNKSTGVAVTATPNAPPLVKPADGAVVSTLPQLVWKPVAGATYYNLQLYRMPSLAAIGGRKILSAWPTSTSLTLKGTWKFAGATYRLVTRGLPLVRLARPRRPREREVRAPHREQLLRRQDDREAEGKAEAEVQGEAQDKGGQAPVSAWGYPPIPGERRRRLGKTGPKFPLFAEGTGCTVRTRS